MRGSSRDLLPLIDRLEKLVFGDLALALLVSEGLFGLKQLLIQDRSQSLLFEEFLLQVSHLLMGLVRGTDLRNLVRESLSLLGEALDLCLLGQHSLLVRNDLLIFGQNDLLELLEVLMDHSIKGGLLGWWSLSNWRRELLSCKTWKRE